MTKTDVAKQIVTFVVNVGTSKIIHGIVSNNTNPERMTDHISIAVGSIVLGSMVADATRKFTDAKIDELITFWQTKVKTQKETV